MLNRLWESLDEATDRFFDKRPDLYFIMVDCVDHVELYIWRKNGSLIRCSLVPYAGDMRIDERKLEALIGPLVD